MLNPSQLSLFIFASLALLITPGPSVLYIVTRSIHQGRKAGFISALGIEFGTFFHIVAAALGLSALLLSSALAFSLVKYLGAAYLIYLGVRSFLNCGKSNSIEAIAPPQNLKRIFLQGIFVNVLNPKTALFFLAFLPQFVDPSRGAVALQILLLGAIFVTIAACSDGLYAVLAGTAGQWLKGNRRFWHNQRYFSGSVYIGLGVSTALAGSDSN